MFDRWELLLASLSEKQLTDSNLPSNLSVKDVIAHLWAWQQLSVARAEAALHGQAGVEELGGALGLQGLQESSEAGRGHLEDPINT